MIILFSAKKIKQIKKKKYKKPKISKIKLDVARAVLGFFKPPAKSGPGHQVVLPEHRAIQLDPE